MSNRSTKGAEKSPNSGKILQVSTTALKASSKNNDVPVQSVKICHQCLTISPDIWKQTQTKSQTSSKLRLFREMFDFNKVEKDDWIFDNTLEICPQNEVFQQELQEFIARQNDEIEELTNKSRRFRIYNILCEALRFCGDKVILPHVKEANKDNNKYAPLLGRLEDWTQVTQYLRRSSKPRNDDQRWLQREINKVVESDDFYMWPNQWHELFNLKLPRDQAVHAAVTLDDLQELFENADIFEENKELVVEFVKRMHRSIPKSAYSTISPASGPISNPQWPRIR